MLTSPAAAPAGAEARLSSESAELKDAGQSRRKSTTAQSA